MIKTFRLILQVIILTSTSVLHPLHLASQVYINEIMASNATILADPDYGNYCDWIEIYNSSDQEIDLNGYYLSDDTTNPAMWQFQSGTMIPANAFILVYADGTGNGNHTNFRLAKEGEQVLLVNAQIEIIDSISYPYQMTDISYGRDADDTRVIGYFEIPTPGEMNGNQLLNGISSKPLFSLEGGFYSGSQTIDINTANPGATICYTLDGTEPTESSVSYTGPINISQNTVLRVKTFEDGMLPSLTTTHSYFIDEPQNLPVISLVTDPDHFFSDETGIYVIGTAGVPGYCTSVPHNVNRDWERPVNIELFEKDGTTGLNQLAGTKIFGGCSRVRYPAKSLAFFARKEYETSSFKYPLFPDKTNEKYETFVLRASADDQPFTLFRDPLTQMVVKDVIDMDIQAYRPAVLYINGEYWGIHNMREKINEHYVKDNYGVNPDSVDMLENNPENSSNVVAGNADHYNAMMAYLKENDITQKFHYDYIKTQMEMDEYINYQIIQIFFGARDWPVNNIKFWRSREAPHHRWRWVLFDVDHMFKEYFSDIMEEATEVDCGCVWPNPPWSTYLFRRLLENETFKHEFIQRFSIYSSTHFSRERMHGFINDMQEVLAPEIPRHIERWGGQRTNLPDNTWVESVFNSVSEWENNVEVMRNFTDTRHEMAMNHVNDYFGTSALAGLETNIAPAGTGKIIIGSTLLDNTEFSGEFSKGEILSIRCIEENRYLFSHWQVNHLSIHDSSLITKGDEWRYMVSRETPDLNWTAINYEDKHWASGKAQLGYGDGDEETVVGYGGNSGNKNITTWFRKKFVIEDTSHFRKYRLNLLRDDGALLFINGLEMVRDNMQRWPVGSYTQALESITKEDETAYCSYNLNPAIFRNGENVIAVEIHQASATSSDISFDLELITSSYTEGLPEIFYEDTLELELWEYTKVTAFTIPDNSIPQIFINEIMASNDGGYVDEMGEYEDWIELYNGGDEAFDLAGLYLTDTPSATTPWKFPANHPETTTILPGGFLVVFADKQPEQGMLHADFRLSKYGEEVLLLQITGDDTVVVDHVIFGSQYKNVTFGRYPDGDPAFEFMPVTTPEASNYLEIISSTDDISTHIIREMEDVTVYPVPTSGPLYVKFSEALSGEKIQVNISVYSMTGILTSETEHRSSEIIRLSLENQSAGLYFIRIKAGDRMFVKRVVKN